MLVRYRIDGILRDTMTLPKNTAPGITARIKILSNLKIDEKRLPQDGRFKIETPEDKSFFPCFRFAGLQRGENSYENSFGKFQRL